MTKNKYHHGNLKETLLKIAFEFIKKNDIDKLTLKVLSDVAGTSRSAIYSHFGSKEALIEAMILDGFIKFDNYLSPSLKDKNIPLLDRLTKASRNYIEFARANKVLYRLLFGNKYAHIRMEVMTKNDPNQSGFGALMFAIEEGQKDGLLKIDNSYKQSITVWSALHGLTSLLIDGFIGIEDMYDELFDNVLNGIISGLLLE
jgi:AcrR family transcriptional regulator